MNNILNCKNLSKSFFEGGNILKVLKGVNLEVKKGEFLSIIGPSGAGKSTLLHLLGGLDKPTSGSVFFEGKNLQNLSDSAISEIRNKSMGFVFQFYHLLNELNVMENIILPYLIRNSGRCPKGMALAALKSVGLAERAHHRPSKLSGGEKQRLAIGRALINKPDIVFCDEPTGNLDSKTSQEIFELLKNINRVNLTTFVVVTHNKDLAGMSDKVVNIVDGKII